jgi:U3 small nucleolar RNA-associated protein 25
VDEEEPELDDASEDEDEKAAAVRPYMALLQGFRDENAPRAKRRKLVHKESIEAPSRPAAEEKEDESGSESDNEGRDVDQVEEPEDPASGLDEIPEDDDSSDEEEDSTDPFDVHFARPDEQLSSKRVEAAKKGGWTTKRALVKPWRATLMHPGSEEGFEVPSKASSLESFRLKQKLKETASQKVANLSDLEKSLGPILFDYKDVLYCDRTVKDSKSLRQIVCLHALNHVLK